MTVPFGLLDDIQLTPSAAPSVRGPVAAPMPRIQAPPQSRFQRLLSSFLPAPKGLESLFTPDELEAARKRGLLDFGLTVLANSRGQANGQPAPSLGQALLAGVNAGRGAFEGQLVGGLQNEMLARELAAQQRIDAAHATMQEFLAPKPGETPEQRNERILSAWRAAVASGDTQTAQAMTAAVQQILSPGGRDRRNPIQVRLGDHMQLRDPDTLAVLADLPINPNPRDPNAPDTAQQMREQRMFVREQQLTDDFNKDTKDARDAAMKIQGAIAETDRALAGDGAAQINMLYAFVNAMDPATAVREGEIALAQAAAPFWDRARAMISKYMSGESVAVPPEMIRRMSELMSRRLRGYQKYVDGRAKYYRGRARYWKLENADELFPSIDIDVQPTSSGKGDANKVRNLLRDQ